MTFDLEIEIIYYLVHEEYFCKLSSKRVCVILLTDQHDQKHDLPTYWCVK